MGILKYVDLGVVKHNIYNMELETFSNEHTEVLLISLGYNEIREIGKGSFGQVYSINTPEGLRAIKTVPHYLQSNQKQTSNRCWPSSTRSWTS